ncbi:MAG: D-lyxose/D-mannose family sugar isomerase [Bryobacteraceae bacterium]
MISNQQYKDAVARAAAMLEQAGFVITPEERGKLEVADFGLGELEKTGLEIITYVNTERCCAKEIILFPRQTCPEHWHPTKNGVPGKEETFRCRWGTVYLYVPGERTATPACRPPQGSEAYYRMAHEVVLKPGEQHTLMPDTPHWFQAGSEGAIVSEFSTRSTDDQDVFRDPRIARAPEVAPE